MAKALIRFPGRLEELTRKGDLELATWNWLTSSLTPLRISTKSVHWRRTAATLATPIAAAPATAAATTSADTIAVMATAMTGVAIAVTAGIPGMTPSRP